MNKAQHNLQLIGKLNLETFRPSPSLSKPGSFQPEIYCGATGSAFSRVEYLSWRTCKCTTNCSAMRAAAANNGALSQDKTEFHSDCHCKLCLLVASNLTHLGLRAFGC